MKRILGAAIVLAFGVAGQAVLAQATHTETTTKHTGPGPDTKMKTETVSGTVKSYDAGKKIEVTGPNNKDYTFDLDENAKVEGSVAVGQWVRVQYRKDDAGKEHVVVLSSGKRAMGHKHGTAAMGSSHESREKLSDSEAQAKNAETGGSMHMESTTKHSGPGPDTKMKTEVVVGTVKDYDPGKKLTVVGPKEKDYSFDLDENVAMKGDVAVGQKVKVEYTKTDSGNKVTVVSPWTGVKKMKKAA